VLPAGEPVVDIVALAEDAVALSRGDALLLAVVAECLDLALVRAF
jgi:hypothetical protein